MSDLVTRIVDLSITGGWALLWFVAVGLAVWQILRGRSLAGAALGAAGVIGLGRLVAGKLFSALFSTLASTLGFQLAGLIQSLTFGMIDGFVLVLLVVAAILQRPPKPADG